MSLTLEFTFQHVISVTDIDKRVSIILIDYVSDKSDECEGNKREAEINQMLNLINVKITMYTIM